MVVYFFGKKLLRMFNRSVAKVKLKKQVKIKVSRVLTSDHIFTYFWLLSFSWLAIYVIPTLTYRLLYITLLILIGWLESSD